MVLYLILHGGNEHVLACMGGGGVHKLGGKMGRKYDKNGGKWGINANNTACALFPLSVKSGIIHVICHPKV